MGRVDNIKLVCELACIHRLSVGGINVWLTEDEIKALECIIEDYNADQNKFKRR